MTLCVIPAFSYQGITREPLSSWLVFSVIVVAASNVLWWMFRLWAYQDEAPMAVKDLPTLPVYLGTASLGGWLRFGDAFGPWKIVGLLLFFPAFFLAQEGSWDYCLRFLRQYHWRIRSPIYLDRCSPCTEQPAQPPVQVG